MYTGGWPVALVFRGDSCPQSSWPPGLLVSVRLREPGWVRPGWVPLCHVEIPPHPHYHPLENQHPPDTIKAVSGGCCQKGSSEKKEMLFLPPALGDLIPPGGGVLTSCFGIPGSEKMELRSQAPHDGNCPNVKASEANVLLRAMLKALASSHPGRGDGEGWASEPHWSRTVKICV